MSATLPRGDSLTQPANYHQSWISRYLFLMAIATLSVMGIGSATRVMNAGLSCPDWPLCYGQLVPLTEMNLLVFLEWFHRVLASSMGLLTLGLVGASWRWRKELPGWLPWGAGFALILVLVQGALGGLTVTELLRFDIVTAHLATGLLFFSCLVMMAVGLAPGLHVGLAWSTQNSWSGWIGLAACVAIYGQSILGALVSSQWAVHQCLAETAPFCGVLQNHFIGVVPATVFSLIVGYLAWQKKPALGIPIVLLLLVQIGLGITTYRLQLQLPMITVCHQIVGACLLASMVTFTTLSFQLRRV
ncbi:MAG: COX15/CtaA family protein [Pseudanabaenaceae cyanobacterium bins.68]|nr:COX15/CtaA family protein [Pseudanabaenaceae cyanobacterium bins.68]